uniref:Choline transporter-like protein n=1 Tax=Xenopsylla cheopis TaxID=163159 RepID=A0A6M2DWF0_XENCH
MGKVDYDEKPIPYDPNFRGPIKHRSCTDIICLIIFLAFVIAWIGIGIYAVTNGDIDKVLHPDDSLKRKCGVHPDVKDKPYLLFFDLVKCAKSGQGPCYTPQVCVDKCPDKDFYFNVHVNERTDVYSLREMLICKPEVNKTRDVLNYESARTLVQNKQCLDKYFQTKVDAYSNICIPVDMQKHARNNGIRTKSLEEAFMSAKSLMRSETFAPEQIVDDLALTWWKIVLLLFGAMLLCLVYIVAMRWLAEFFVWFSIGLVIAILAAGCGIAFYYFAVADSEDDTRYLLVAAGLVPGILLLLIIIVLCCSCKNIKISIALIKLSGRAIGSLRSTLIFPLYPWTLQCVVLACAVVVAMYLISLDNNGSSILDPFHNMRQQLRTDGSWNCTQYLKSIDEDHVPIPCNENFVKENCIRMFSEPIHYDESHFDAYEHCKMAPRIFDDIDDDDNEKNDYLPLIFHAYNIVALVWLVTFIQMMSDMVLAMSFATWYWTWKKKDVPFFTVFNSTVKTYTYHTGTLAFGSLLLTICRIIRYMLKEQKNGGNACYTCLLCLCRCIFWCIERIIKFITKYATIMCAIHGKNFCTSAKNSMSLILRNVGLFSIGNFVTSSLLFMSKLLVTLIMGIIAYAVFGDDWIALPVDEKVLYWYTPVAIVAAGTFIVATVFFAVYDMAIDTIALCFLEDCERNDGSPDRPYFMSTELLKIMEKSNKKQ